MKKLSALFAVLSILLSDIMCAVVAYNYRGMLCNIKHSGASAPAYVALFLIVPYAIGIIICITLAVIFAKKANR